MKNFKKFNESLNEHDLYDFLQSTKVIYNIENDKHPTIKSGSEKHKEFKDWYESEYMESGKLDEFIKSLNY